MAQAKPLMQTGSNRPVSPHLQVYSLLINMVMSIVHRITGMALYFGTLLLAWWLIAAATGPDAFSFAASVLGSPIGLIVLFGYTWAFMHHLLGGVRHLIWDTGAGFSLRAIDAMSWLTLVGSVILTLGVWFVVLRAKGAI